MTVVLRNCATCLLGFALATTAWAAQPLPLGCLIEPFQVADVGSPVIGVIEKIHVERGDLVRKGQPLAVLRADVERAQLGVASSKAQANAEVNAAIANAALAKQKLTRAQDLLERHFISRQALEQAIAEARVADERVVQAREQKRTAEREFELAQAQVGMRTIRAPSDGVIADRYLSVGERVEEKPVFRVSMVDPLRVEVVMPAQLFGTVSPDSTLTITPEFPNAGPREAKVVLVDKLIDGASNTFRIRLALPNPGARLPAGLRCKASLGAAAGAAESATAKGGRFKKIGGDAQPDGVADKMPPRRSADAPLRMEYSLPNPKTRN
jgi:RND family efflux transporter MFP subunit